MQRRSFAISVLAGAGILVAGCGGGGDESGALPLDPSPGPGPGSEPGPAPMAHAYMAMPASAEVAIYGMLVDGSLKAIGTVSAEAGTTAVAVLRSGLFAYAVNADARTISIYDRDRGTGSLRLRNSFALVIFGRPSEIRFHPSQEIAYVATGSGVGVYSVDAGTGALQFVRFQASGPEAIDIHPSGAFLFAGRDTGLRTARAVQN